MKRGTQTVILNDATSQYDRWQRSAAFEGVAIDGRTVPELLSFAVEFGRLVTFYNLNDQPEGDWSSFFLSDPTMILACVASFNVVALERDCYESKGDTRRANRETKRTRPGAALLLALQISRQIDHWLTLTQMNQQSKAVRTLGVEISHWIESCLGRGLRSVQSYVLKADFVGRTGLSAQDFTGFHAQWKLAAVGGAGEEGREEQGCDAGLPDVDGLLEDLFLAVRHIQQVATQCQSETLCEPDHMPQVAMYIAFVSLFQHAKRTLNEIGTRFSNFYYTDLLRATPAGPVADQVYLIFGLDPASGIDPASVPAGTEFTAGKELDGTAINYVNAKALSVTSATLTDVLSIRTVDAPLYVVTGDAGEASSRSEPPATIPSAIKQVLVQRVDTASMNAIASGKAPAGSPSSWSLFGDCSIQSNALFTSKPARLGFALASDYLMLTGGKRKVTVTFHCTDTLPQSLYDSVTASTGLTDTQVFEGVMGQGFELFCSTAEGWFPVASYVCTATMPTNTTGQISSFNMVFQLDATEPPLVAFNPSKPPAKPPQPDDLNPVPGLPTLKAYLRQAPVQIKGPAGTVALYPISLLSAVLVDTIEVQTTTTELADLMIETTVGSIDPASPFPGLGPVPVPGSFLQVRNPELFVKTPDPGTLNLNVTWFGLPANADGFSGYYRGYLVGLDGEPLQIDNQTFRGDISVVNPGFWTLSTTCDSHSTSDADSALYLFRSQPIPADPVPAKDGALVALSSYSGLPVTASKPPMNYDPESSAIRLSLTDPPYAFGSLLYPANVMNAVLADLPGSKSTPTSVAQKPPAVNTLEDAADAVAHAVTTAPPDRPSDGDAKNAASYRSHVYSAIQSIAEQLVTAAQDRLAASIPPTDLAAMQWISELFATPASSAPAYRAQKIRSRIQAAQSSLGTALPATAKPAASIASMLLQGVIWLQSALDSSAATPVGEYRKSAEDRLNAVEKQLRQGGGPTPVAAPAATKAPAHAAWLSKAEPSTSANSALSYPNQPLLPQVQSITVDYQATCSFMPAGGSAAAGQIFYLGPGDGCELVSASPMQLFPVPGPGTLLLGFTGMDAAQTLELLVQMTTGTATTTPAVTWQSLSSGLWTNLPSEQILSDTTHGLHNTGVLTLELPATGARAASAAVPDLRWLRAMTDAPDQFAPAVGVYPHVLLAAWDGTSSGQHLSRPLPPCSIKGAVQNLAGIKTIQQPLPSFGGRPAEDERALQTRLAERLRHKDRASLAWDYEQLVLERYPTIWQVRALPAQPGMQPGGVVVVVVAGANGLQASSPIEPLVDSETLGAIRNDLQSVASPFAAIQVVNPVYVRIQVTADVIFAEATSLKSSSGGGIDQLNRDLIQYLSPWFYDVERAVRRVDYTSRSAILRFMQTRPYVSAVVDIDLTYHPSPAGLPWFYLTSAPSHSITQADADVRLITKGSAK